MRRNRGWLIAGACLDAIGALLVGLSLLRGEPPLAVGIVLVIAGSSLIFQGVLRASRGEQQGEQHSAKPDLSKWRLEPELRGPTPRTVQLAPTGRRLAMVWGLMILALAAYVLFFASRAAPDQEIIERQGVRTTGKVHDKAVREGPNGTTYYIYYNFSDSEGNGIRSSVRVSESAFASTDVNNSIEVVYLPENPLTHVVPGITERRKVPPVVLLVAGFVALPLAMGEIIRRRHRDLVARGAAAAGIVRNLRRRGAAQLFAAHYQVAGEERRIRGSLRNANLCEGDLLTVLYLPDHPGAALLYVSSLYRAV